MTTTLFSPPTQIWDMQPYAFQNTMARSGVNGLGDVWSDIASAIKDTTETVFGAKQARSAQENAAAIAKAQAEAETAASAARSAALAKYLPWVAAALAIGTIGVVYVMKK